MSHIAQRPSPLACKACREKHLKCDATTPVCSRCRDRGLHCSYVASRRGCGGRTKRQASAGQVQTQIQSQQSLPTLVSNRAVLTPQTSIGQGSSSASASGGVSPGNSWSHPSVEGQVVSPPGSTTSSCRSSLRSEDEHLVNLYYAHFHPEHPMLVPRSRWYNQNYPEYLQLVAKFIGSQYASNISSDRIRSVAAESLSENSNDKSPEMVQASLLYSISLHARYEPMEAMAAISNAADVAIALGMHHSEFSTSHGHGDPIYEESLRRTWWELYITDGYFASLHRQTNFKSNSVTITTLLPCEDQLYDRCGVPSQSFSLQDYDGRLFADEDWQFSSASYRIDAVRILARVIDVSSANKVHADSIQSIDNAMASWKFHLPNDKAGIVVHSGEVDPMMFQAFMLIYIGNIFLHFPRSELPITMPASADIACARRHMEQVSPTSSQHAAKALSASKDLANLAALPVTRYSPFFICSLVFACVVQLSACSAYPKATTEPNRDRVALIIGVLKSVSRNWSIAKYVSQQLKKAAHEVFNPRVDVPSTQSVSSYDSGIAHMNMGGIDMSWFDMFYSDGMQGLAMGTGELAGL
ncbi:uncharacterized protein SEPMUDRAFT_149735 [Sphaerulina musiva SO2202]|uniref:Zn(2)-C6 fungal-type domain-containing protein n=1 Tax=Sphaerulina musiva (strain SO2202) TaxID=692275 RepID=N1QHG3_SPHMS|nr:uncharacterized protein SEPMUDRAFT_149735 [Sphaerulina musiva SO2202]EMF11884.1 hypothetical protein SEPMUDRAFT_149735 [Sphaerulina musiva SO2202]